MRAQAAWAVAMILSTPIAPLARAEPPPKVASAPRVDDDAARPAVALLVGAATALVPFAVGGTLMATGADEGTRSLGAYVSMGGLVLAPITSHGVFGEWGRGLLFSTVPAAGTAGMATLLALRTDAVLGGKLGANYAFVSILLVSFVGSAVGVFDAALAPSRARSRIQVAPLVGGGRAGIVIGGDL